MERGPDKMKRKAGILMPVFSLPSAYGIGCFSKEAYHFVDWLETAGQSCWQILPMGPTGFGSSADSPYQSYSAFAGNPFFIDLETLVTEGLLTEKECLACDFGNALDCVDYRRLHQFRMELLRKAYSRSTFDKTVEYVTFTQENEYWLQDYALFMALKSYFLDAPWDQWPDGIRFRHEKDMLRYQKLLCDDIHFHCFLQFLFYRQWKQLRLYANKKGISIIGDIPIYVSPDSADIWSRPELFQVDSNRKLTAVAGCPPDDFCRDGQLWNNPLYFWPGHRSDRYQWWVARMRQSFFMYDIVRMDHFRGFDTYYCVAAGSRTAADGHWESGPGMELFRRIEEELGPGRIIAEDLGLITDSVRQLVRESGYPNMKVLAFAFDPYDKNGENEHLPHNYNSNCVVYTGTHDNETMTGWLKGMSSSEREWICRYLGIQGAPERQICMELIRLAMMSVAETCIIPIQDYLCLDNSARVNRPGTVTNNWCWRILPDFLTAELARSIGDMTGRYGRAGRGVSKNHDEKGKTC